jgi:hypothetical protein
MKRITLALLVFLLATSARTWAWSSPGHIVIAAIAYRELSADDKKAVSELLTHHPAYSKWKQAFKPQAFSFDLDTYIFMRASTWPDDIRETGNHYDHPKWHYVNYPLNPPKFAVKPSPSTKNDLLFGIAQCQEVLQNSEDSLEVRAAYLSWLIHLVGDAHQPLHCVTFISSDYSAPQGDKGGNLFYVRPATKGVKLHAIWDQGLGSAVDFAAQYNYATQIRAEHPRGQLNLNMSPELIKDLSTRGREVGVAFVSRFASPKPGCKLDWQNHRWVRLRSALALLEENLINIDRSCAVPLENDLAYDQWVKTADNDALPSYPWGSASQRQHAVNLLASLRQCVQSLQGTAADQTPLAVGAPRPRPELRVRPRV